MDENKCYTDPDVMTVNEAWSFIDDHHGKSHLRVIEWGNGEGITIEIDDDGMGKKYQRLELTWSRFDAIKACVEAIIDAP